MRRLVIRGETWGWRFGRAVSIRSPDGRGFRVDLRDLTGMDWNEIERGTHKRYFSIEPQRIVDHVDRTILGYDDARGFPKGVLPRGWRPELRQGWSGVEGPRGLWQWRPAPWIVQIRSPEDVSHEVRVYDLLDMTVDEWADLKAASIVASGSTVDDEIRRARARRGFGRGAEGFLDWDAPGLPQPTAEQVRGHVERLVAGVGGRGAGR
jgi:hypothetical protein